MYIYIYVYIYIIYYIYAVLRVLWSVVRSALSNSNRKPKICGLFKLVNTIITNEIKLACEIERFYIELLKHRIGILHFTVTLLLINKTL